MNEASPEQKGASAKAARLRSWLAGLVRAYSDRILGVDVETAAFAGRLEAKAIASGGDPGMADATLAGVAQAHGLVVVTRNRKDFIGLGVELLSPEEAAAA